MVDRLFMLDAHSGLSEELRSWLSIPIIPHLNATAPLPLEVSPAVLRTIERIYSRDLAVYRYLAAHGGVADARGVDFDGIRELAPGRRLLRRR